MVCTRCKLPDKRVEADISARCIPRRVEKLGQLIERGVIVASDEVFEELKRKDDHLCEWAKKQAKMFVPPDAEIQRVVSDILGKSPKLIDTRRN